MGGLINGNRKADGQSDYYRVSESSKAGSSKQATS